MIPGGCSGGIKSSRRVSDGENYLLTLAHRATEGINGDDNFDVSYKLQLLESKGLNVSESWLHRGTVDVICLIVLHLPGFAFQPI